MWLPKYKTLLLPTSCALSCEGCTAWLSKRQILTDIPDLSTFHNSLVHITGGDPLLHQKLPHIIHTLKNQGNLILLTAPAMRLNLLPPETLKALAFLFIYMPGADQETLHQQTGFDVYAQYYLTLSMLTEMHTRALVTYPVTATSIEQLPDIYALTKKLKHLLFLTHNRTQGAIPHTHLNYYRQKRTVISYTYTDTTQNTCLGCPQKLWRVHPLSAATLIQGFSKIYL